MKSCRHLSFLIENIYTILSDKLKVRAHVSSKIGSRFLTRVVWSGERLEEFYENGEHPSNFIIKANHSSGTNIICRDLINFDWSDACAQASSWLEVDYSRFWAEWQYRWISRRLLVEELLVMPDGKIPLDYKFHCFNGKVGFVQVDFDRASNHSRLLFDAQYNILNVSYSYQLYTGIHGRPKNFDLMIELADKLSDGFTYVRVDLYDLGEKVFFGEMTFHPGAGIEHFCPESFDRKIVQEYY